MIALLLAFQAIAADYKSAFRATETNGRPLVVLVGTPWCPGCRTMKQGVIPRLAGRGILAKVNYVEVDSDDDWKLASQLLDGDTIPQLVIFTPTSKGWVRERLTGAKSEAEVEAMIDRALKAQK